MPHDVLLAMLVDLTVAIQAGMVLAAFLFMRRMAEVMAKTERAWCWPVYTLSPWSFWPARVSSTKSATKIWGATVLRHWLA